MVQKNCLKKISTLNLKAHLFGHIHAQRGLEFIYNTLFSNGAILDADYIATSSPNVITI